MVQAVEADQIGQEGLRQFAGQAPSEVTALVYALLGGATGWMTSGQLLGALGAAIIGIVCLLVYVGMLALLRAPELAPAMGIARRLIRR